jgi:tRNA dimethylallyltransferase
MGPTASGKSAVALELAQRLPLEIVSVDSAQVYRGMDIGTAKPDLATRARVPHHLIDIIDPDAAYSAARFRSDALDAIATIRARGRVALVVGGTMLCFKALREGLQLPAPIPVYARNSMRAPRPKAGPHCMRSSLASIPPRRRGSSPPTPSASSVRLKSIWSRDGRCRRCTARATPRRPRGRWRSR